MALKIKEIEGDFGEVIQGLIQDKDLEMVEEEDDFQIWRETTYTYIPKLNIDVHAAISSTLDEDGEFMPDSDLYIVYDHGTKQRLYTEFGSSLSVCIYNFCYAFGKTEWHDLEKIEDMGCFYVLDPDPFKRKKPVR